MGCDVRETRFLKAVALKAVSRHPILSDNKGII